MKLWALENAGVDNWINYGESIKDFRESMGYSDDRDLTQDELLIALESGGVDNWQGWDYACELLQEYYY